METQEKTVVTVMKSILNPAQYQLEIALGQTSGIAQTAHVASFVLAFLCALQHTCIYGELDEADSVRAVFLW